MADVRGAVKTALTVLVALGIPTAMISTYLGYTAYRAWMAESEEVTGAVALRKDGVVYVVVSGESEKITTRSDKSRSVSVEHYPRVASYRASDGEKVATRQYAPVFFRFSYVDTVVRALAAGDGNVWVMATNPEISLHAVDPVTLADTIDHAALTARAPAIAPGIYVVPGATSPVVVSGKQLVFRLLSGPWLALDPTAVTTRALPVSRDEPDEDDFRGSTAVEARVRGRADVLEPRVFSVFDLDGKEDTSVSFVASQTSLDHAASGMKITRWDTRGATAVEGWTTTLPSVHPVCCVARAWRTDGLAILWYEDWLMAFDEASGATRWVRRL